MQIKEMAEEMGYEVLHGIVDCLWVIEVSLYNSYSDDSQIATRERA
jgi:DNA polymerase elongation subunit (family B)